MAIFTAGCIELTTDIRKIRNSVYDLAKYDLDSPAMKVSVRKSNTCINFIAFLPKDKINKENILKKVSECEKRSVVVFELDYKFVGVVCEYGRIIDYILDKPKEFAKERGYETVFVDNSNGVELVMFNLDTINREAKAGFMSLGFTILLTSAIFFSGYAHLKDTCIHRDNKDNLVEQYRELVKKEFEVSKKIVQKVDTVQALEDIERLMQLSGSNLERFEYKNDRFCVKVKTPQLEPLLRLLPKNMTIKEKDTIEGSLEYCYEKI
ncbi:MAG: hypothetical protein JXQ66_01645 [Campylobacterales bacterium]|nr:hypothetical protein [Campylobacterales bacterium]